MNYLDIANSPLMWAVCIPAIAMTVIQAVLFFKKAWNTGLAMGIEKERMLTCMRASAITSIGPSFAILSGLLSLMVIAGKPIAWLRLNFIGSLAFEHMAFNAGVTASGATTETVTLQAFTNGVWVMILASIGWIIFSIIGTPQMDKWRTRIGGKGGDSTRVLGIMGTAAMVGCMASPISGYIAKPSKNVANIVAAVVGILVMIAIYSYNSKKNIRWLREWCLTIALFAGMIVAGIVAFA